MAMDLMISRPATRWFLMRLIFGKNMELEVDLSAVVRLNMQYEI